MTLRRLIPFLLFGFVCAGFLRLTQFDFIPIDDDHHVFRNPAVTSPSARGLAEVWTQPYFGMYIPVTYSVWQLASRLSPSGVNPALFHGLNVLFHAATVVLLFELLFFLVGDLLGSLLGALFFAFHPVQVEAVAWVSGFREVLSGFFSLAALYFYCRRKNRTVSSLLFVLACLAKPSAALLPALALAFDWGWRKKSDPVLLVWTFVSLGVGWETHLLQLPVAADVGVGLWLRPLILIDALAFYVAKLFFPLSLGLDYARSPNWVLTHWNENLGGFILTAVGFASLVFWAGRKGMALVGLFVFSLLPVSGLIPFAYQQFSTVADRYLYLSLLAPALALTLFLQRYSSKTVGGIVVLMLCGYWVRTEIALGKWRDGESLLTHGVSVSPKSVLLHQNLGTLRFEQGRYLDAVFHYEQAMKYGGHRADMMGNCAEGFLRLGKFAKAEEWFRRAIALDSNNAVFQNDLGTALLNQGKFSEALACFEEASRLAPFESAPKINAARTLRLNREFVRSKRTRDGGQMGQSR